MEYLLIMTQIKTFFLNLNPLIFLYDNKMKLTWEIIHKYFESAAFIDLVFNESMFSKNYFIFPTRSIAFRLDLSDTIKMMDVDYLNKHLRYYTLKGNKHIFSLSPIRFYLRSKGINDPKSILKCVNKKYMIRVVVWGNHLLM